LATAGYEPSKVDVRPLVDERLVELGLMRSSQDGGAEEAHAFSGRIE
jgi:hypothetical protein